MYFREEECPDCKRHLVASEDGKSLYCPQCREYFPNPDFDEIADAEGRFGA